MPHFDGCGPSRLQNVTITVSSSGTGAATFTASAAGLTSVTFTATEAAACTSNCGHVADPFTGAKPYLNPDYVKEVQAQATGDGSSAEARVGSNQTAIWLDTIGWPGGPGWTLSYSYSGNQSLAGGWKGAGPSRARP